MVLKIKLKRNEGWIEDEYVAKTIRGQQNGFNQI
jgi:hypothetical protein